MSNVCVRRAECDVRVMFARPPARPRRAVLVCVLRCSIVVLARSWEEILCFFVVVLQVEVFVKGLRTVKPRF